MRAVVLKEKRTVVVEEVRTPEMTEQTDVLMRVTSTSVCGTDLHFYEGRMPYFGHSIGHEPMGVVEEVGSAVKSVKKGDRIVVPTHICCGFCPNCTRGFSAACLTTNPGSAGAAYGYPDAGDYPGAQAEYVRIPLADANCLKLPGEPGDAWENDFAMLADSFPTGWHATEVAKVGAGDPVAIFGAGAVGLLAAHSALLRGASVVYVVDAVKERLAKAEEFGAVAIDLSQGDPVKQIMEDRKRRRMDTAYRDEHAMDGVMCGIDAIGFQARSLNDPKVEDPGWVFRALTELVNPTGRIAVIGVFPPKDPEGVDPAENKGDLTVPWGKLFKKGITVAFGRDQDERYNLMLRNMIVAGRTRPGSIVSHRLPISAAPDAFRKFAAREDGYVKIVLDPTS